MAKRPHVLIMMADDHRAAAIAAHGDPIVKTPCMDGLCGRGVTFRQNRHQGSLSGAVCGPARAALLTGAHPLDASIGRSTDDFASVSTLRSERTTLPQAFREAGYRTIGIGKWHNDKPAFARSFSGAGKVFFGGMTDQFEVALQDYDPSGEYASGRARRVAGFTTETFANEAIAQIAAHDPQQPMLMYVAFTSPHDPRTAPQPWHDMYRPEDMPLPDNFAPEHPFDLGDFHVRDEMLADHPRSEAEICGHIADYYAMISSQDHHMSRILAALEQAGMLEETLVVYTGDHGLAVGQHGLMGKQNLYEHSTRTPLMIAGPGVPQGLACDALTYTPDLYPTLCELAGLAIPASVEAKSLVPLLTDPEAPHREHATCFYKRYQRMITDGRYKLIRSYHDPQYQQGADVIQLFDLQADPGETCSLAGDPQHRQRLEALDAALTESMLAMDDPLLEAKA